MKKRTSRGAAVTRDSFANAPYAELVRHLAVLREVDLVRKLALHQDAQEKLSAAIIRFVRRCEASGPAKDTMAKNRRDYQLRDLLFYYESESEVIGMMGCVGVLKTINLPNARAQHRH